MGESVVCGGECVLWGESGGSSPTTTTTLSDTWLPW